MIDAVIKIGGLCLDEKNSLRSLCWEVAELVRQKSRIVLVHGGGDFLDRHLKNRGFETVKKYGVRRTPPEQLAEIVGVLCGQLNKQFVASLQQEGIKSVGLCGVDGSTAIAAPLSFADFDPALVGQIVGGDGTLLHQLVEGNFVPVLAPVAADGAGQLYNINADSFAAGLARILNAKRLVMMTDVAGVKNSDGQIVARVSSTEIETWIQNGTIRDGMIPKVRAALHAVQESGCEVVIASWNISGALVLAATGKPVGTAIEPSRVAAVVQS